MQTLLSQMKKKRTRQRTQKRQAAAKVMVVKATQGRTT
jgi:hypothetical protein